MKNSIFFPCRYELLVYGISVDIRPKTLTEINANRTDWSSRFHHFFPNICRSLSWIMDSFPHNPGPLGLGFPSYEVRGLHVLTVWLQCPFRCRPLSKRGDEALLLWSLDGPGDPGTKGEVFIPDVVFNSIMCDYMTIKWLSTQLEPAVHC